MVQLGDVIELESSPEPITYPHPRVATTPSTVKSRDKGKGKATPYRTPRRALASSVIELTDSESEDDNDKSRNGTQVSHGDSDASPGPSSQKWKGKDHIQYSSPHTLRQLDNIPTTTHFASSSSSGPSNLALNAPLFLPSDEEKDSIPITAPTERVDVGAIDNAPTDIGQEPTISNPDPEPQIPAQQTPVPPDVAPTPDFDPVPIKNMDIDPTSTAVAQILEIIPDVEPTHLLKLIETHLPTFAVPHDAGGGGGEQQVQGVVGHVLHLLFEDPNYPKVDKKGKGKRVAEAEDDNAKVVPKKPKIDYATVDRPYPGGPNYFDLVLYHLQSSFPHIPKPYLRRQLQGHKNLYAPTHLSILAAEKTFEENKQLQRPYTIKSIRHTLRKPQGDVAFDEEKAWLDAELGIADGKGVDTAAVEEEVVDADIDEADDGTGIECQCCFADYPFAKMVQCPEAHLFCSTCISTYAATQLGTHNSSLTCIHPSSCSFPFPASELKRILPVKLYELYERLEQQKQIMQAGLVGLEECPFCEWKCVLEVSSEEDKLFRCGNEDGGCGAVSCRGCKKLDHLPKSCKEVEEDKHLDGRHAIEEAMTRAMMRNCPTCQKAFIKELGCNKMSCPNCRTLSCYVCRQVIKGYDHFNQAAPGAASTSANSKKCLLWEPVEERHAQEVKEAAEKAMREYKRDHPDVEESAIKVDLPEAPAAVVPGPPIVPVIPVFPAMNYPNPYRNLFGGQQLPVPHWHQHQQQQHQQQQQQQAANQRQPVRQQPQRHANARARAAEQRRQQAKERQKNAKTERARIAEQVRLAEEHRARHGLDRVREQMVVARREEQQQQQQGGGARLAMAMARQRQPPQAQMQVQLQGQGQPQVPGPARQEPYRYRHRHHPQQPQPQPQPQQMMMVPPPQVAENPPRRGRSRKKK